MKVILYTIESEPEAKIKCDCGTEFWIDPCGEENLQMMRRPSGRDELTEVCPTCGKTNQDSHLVYPVLSQHWIITLPKTVDWKTYEKELKAVEDGSLELYFKVPPHFKAAKKGDRCYITHNGYVKGWMQVTGLVKSDGFQCTTTGTTWPKGTYITRSGKFHPVNWKIPVKGFQGIRKYANNVTEGPADVAS